jgi:signal transduction histidine kinase
MLETMYQKLFHSAPVPLIVTDKKGTIKLTNGHADVLLNNKSTPLEGLSFFDFIDQSLLRNYLHDHSSASFEDFLKDYEAQHDHWLKNKKGITVYADIKAVSPGSGDEELYIWTFDPTGITKKLTYDLNERVKEQLCILNVIELCFQNQDANTTLQRCLQPIREGWQFPEAAEVRITLASGEEFTTGRFRKTEWYLQSEIRTTNEYYGYLEVCYRHRVPAYGDKTFLYEEERLIKVLGKIIGTVIGHWYSNKRINEAVVNAQEEERFQLAMELHDNVQQILTAASLQVAYLENIQRDEISQQTIQNLKKALAEGIKELRRLSRQLAPSVDPDFPLTEKISSLAKNMNVNDRLRAKINIDPEIVLSERIQLGFYRIVQEQLTNIIKHAGSSEVEISIKAEGKDVKLNIIDKGKGFDMNSKRNGIGFENIRRRTELMNGSLDIVSSPGKGTRLTVLVPNIS